MLEDVCAKIAKFQQEDNQALQKLHAETGQVSAFFRQSDHVPAECPSENILNPLNRL